LLHVAEREARLMLIYHSYCRDIGEAATDEVDKPLDVRSKEQHHRSSPCKVTYSSENWICRIRAIVLTTKLQSNQTMLNSCFLSPFSYYQSLNYLKFEVGLDSWSVTIDVALAQKFVAHRMRASKMRRKCVDEDNN